jgi:TetR/AcrR family transcriptional regulator
MCPKKLTQREQQSLQTRQALLATSLELFVRKGFAGTTVRDIAKAARVSPGLMFHYFPSKDALLQAHVRLMAAGIDSMAERLKSSAEPLATFRDIAETTLASFSEPYSKNLFLLANQVLSLDSIPSGAKKMVSKSKAIDASASLISVGQHRDEIGKGDPHALAVAFWGALQGIAEILVWNPDTPIPHADHVISILRK